MSFAELRGLALIQSTAPKTLSGLSGCAAVQVYSATCLLVLTASGVGITTRSEDDDVTAVPSTPTAEVRIVLRQDKV
jgi:hypothetical protein